MAFSHTNSKGVTYILHSRTTTLKTGTRRRFTSLLKPRRKELSTRYRLDIRCLRAKTVCRY